MKHIGKMKNNGAKVVVAYRTLPGDSGNALVIGTGGLSDSWHDSLMSLVQDPDGQQANELADILAVRKFPDGLTMLEALHNRGQLKRVPTSGVIMTMGPNSEVPLSELNALIAEQRGVTIDELAISDGPVVNPKRPTINQNKKDDPTKTTSASVNSNEVVVEEVPRSKGVEVEQTETTFDLSASQLRSKADKLFKEAQTLRKQADELDPPKSKKKSVTVSVV